MKQNIIDKSYQLMVMLGEILNEMDRDGDPVTKEEIEQLYGLASEVHDHIAGN